MFVRAALLAPLFALSACGQEAPAQETLPPEEAEAAPAPVFEAPSITNFTIIGSDGSEIGAAKLTGGPNGVLMRATISAGSLTPGWHGIHFHQVGDCSDVGTFKLSGGHVGLIEGGHGLLNPIGPEAGDIPNIFAHEDGSAGYEMFSDFISLEQLFDEDGTALVIHANEDDHISQPIGGAGARIACGVIE